MLMWMGYYLASRGYIVAAVNHHGNTAAESQPAAQGFLLYWERPKDLTVTLDKLLADPVFGTRIDRKRIGAAGFSLGGYTVISIAGGISHDRPATAPIPGSLSGSLSGLPCFFTGRNASRHIRCVFIQEPEKPWTISRTAYDLCIPDCLVVYDRFVLVAESPKPNYQ